MIRVLELIDGGFLGGGQMHIMSLIKNFDKQKIYPVVSASANGEFGDFVKRSGYKFEQADLPKIYRSKYLKEIEGIIKKNKIEIIHSHGGVAGMYSRFYKKKFGNIRTIHTIHGIHYINSANIFRKFFTHMIEEYLVPYTDSFICVSDADFKTAESIKIINPEKTSVIKNGIDIEKFRRKIKNRELCERLGIMERNFVIGNISRFDIQKNQIFIIENSKEILSENPVVKILLAGSGRYLDECRRAADKSGFGDRFIFPGEILNPEEYYPLFDIFVFPSKWEGLSLSLMESMASSNCIMASRIPGNEELIKDNFNGMLFDTKDDKEYKDKLKQLIEYKEKRDKLSTQAGSDSDNYSEKIMTEKTESEYHKLLN